jgi:hypothetical protein
MKKEDGTGSGEQNDDDEETGGIKMMEKEYV